MSLCYHCLKKMLLYTKLMQQWGIHVLPALSDITTPCDPSACRLWHSLCWQQELFKALKVVNVCSNQTVFHRSSEPLLLHLNCFSVHLKSHSAQMNTRCWKQSFSACFLWFSCVWMVPSRSRLRDCWLWNEPFHTSVWPKWAVILGYPDQRDTFHCFENWS